MDQVASARKLASIGMLESRRALQMLRDGETPDLASLPGLVSETSAMLGIPVTLQSRRPVPARRGAGLTLYRVVQEALTNVAKHAGAGREVTVRLAWDRTASRSRSSTTAATGWTPACPLAASA